MYKKRQSLFTECSGLVCAQPGCEYDVVGTAMASRACRAGNIMEAKFSPKMYLYLLVNEFCARLRTTRSIYVHKPV